MSCIISLSLVMGVFLFDFTTLNIVDMLNRVLRIDKKKTPRTFKIPLRTALRIYILLPSTVSAGKQLIQVV